MRGMPASGAKSQARAWSSDNTPDADQAKRAQTTQTCSQSGEAHSGSAACCPAVTGGVRRTTFLLPLVLLPTTPLLPAALPLPAPLMSRGAEKCEAAVSGESERAPASSCRVGSDRNQ